MWNSSIGWVKFVCAGGAGVGGNGPPRIFGCNSGRRSTGRGSGSGCGAKTNLPSGFARADPSFKSLVRKRTCRQYLNTQELKIRLKSTYVNKFSIDTARFGSSEFAKSTNLSFAFISFMSKLRCCLTRGLRFARLPPNFKNSIVPSAKCPEWMSNAVPIGGCSSLKMRVDNLVTFKTYCSKDFCSLEW